MTLEACLPAELRGDGTTITPIAAGLSHASVYRVDASGRSVVLKVASQDEPLPRWRARVRTQQLAASAGLTPNVIHVDESRRAVVSDFVVDRSFPAAYMDPRTRDAAVAKLGRMVRGVHRLPLPPDAEAKDPREFLAELWSALGTNFEVPAFASEAIRRRLSDDGPPSDRNAVLSHNDVNPSNLVYDGEHLLLLDWDAAGANDPFYDLATIAVFLRMDEDTCRNLLTAYDDRPVEEVPARFHYNRRLVAVLSGTMFLSMARRNGHNGANGETLESTPSLADCYQRLRTGAFDIATGADQWSFGLALIKEAYAVRASIPE